MKALPTNIPAVESNELRLDHLFLLDDGAVGIIDYESDYSLGIRHSEKAEGGGRVVGRKHISQKIKHYIIQGKQVLISILLFITLVFVGCSNRESETETVYEREPSIEYSENDISLEQEPDMTASTESTKNIESTETTESIEDLEHNEISVPNAGTAAAAEGTKEETEEETAEENKLCTGLAKEIYEETNKERIAAGLPALVWSDELAEAADIRAEEIIDCFDHVRPDGTKCYALGDRIHGENLGKGPEAESSGYEFVRHWMESPGHRANILRKEYTLIGVGTRSTEMGYTAVQIFGY